MTPKVYEITLSILDIHFCSFDQINSRQSTGNTILLYLNYLELALLNS
jgi:hypothetical protein